MPIQIDKPSVFVYPNPQIVDCDPRIIVEVIILLSPPMKGIEALHFQLSHVHVA